MAGDEIAEAVVTAARRPGSLVFGTCQGYCCEIRLPMAVVPSRKQRLAQGLICAMRWRHRGQYRQSIWRVGKKGHTPSFQQHAPAYSAPLVARRLQPARGCKIRRRPGHRHPADFCGQPGRKVLPVPGVAGSGGEKVSRRCFSTPQSRGQGLGSPVARLR